MESIKVKINETLDVRSGLLVVPVCKEGGYPAEIKPFMKGLEKDQFEGKAGQTYATSTFGKASFGRLFVYGLGSKEDCVLDSFRKAAAAGVRYAVSNRIGSVSVSAFPCMGFGADDVAQAVTEGILLSAHKFTAFKTEKQDIFRIKSALVISSEKSSRKAFEKGKILSLSQIYSREIDENPGNVMTPEKIAEYAKKLAKKNNLKCTVFDERKLREMKMNGILAVGAGSCNKPRLVTLEYNRGKNLPFYAVVGKGITFDAGGISLKPSKKMDEMKYDKTGAVVSMGVIKAVSELSLPIRLIAVLPLAENLPASTAQRPGDIIKIRNGKTVEVLNTDAEGRLVLADALSYVSEMKPDVVLDVATLTGAVIVALGKQAIGLMSDDDELAGTIEECGVHTHERVWRLPLWKEYSEMMKGTFADLKNISETREAGTVTAAAFLKEFVGEKIRWAHLDIAGVMDSDGSHPYYEKGATATGVRLITETFERLSKKKG